MSNKIYNTFPRFIESYRTAMNPMQPFTLEYLSIKYLASTLFHDYYFYQDSVFLCRNSHGPWSYMRERFHLVSYNLQTVGKHKIVGPELDESMFTCIIIMMNIQPDVSFQFRFMDSI